MNITALRMRRACWIALLAMLALALAPTLSHALGASRGAAAGADIAWVDICTSGGTQEVVIGEPAQNREPPRSAASHLEHCAYCSLAGHTPALLSAASAGLGLEPSSATQVPLWPQAPYPPFAWSNAQPRAPPAPL